MDNKIVMLQIENEASSASATHVVEKLMFSSDYAKKGVGKTEHVGT